MEAIRMKNGRTPELLAPAGDMEGLRAAMRFGADAVYAGGPFLQLRAKSAGFDIETLALAAKELHSAGKRLYITVNCFAKNDELKAVPGYVRELKACGADAVIVSDLGVLLAVREGCPEMEVHVSTQANCMNYGAAAHYYALGAKRVVLARELSIEEIGLLRKNAPEALELEAFVHGAMCMAYSGRCLMSAFMIDRSGNRGACAQSCRWSYRLQEEKRPGEYYTVEETENGSAILSSYDLCAVNLLKPLADAGVCSLKIEGRMKSEYYIGAVANAYRMALDGTATPEEIRSELEAVSHRPYCTGFYEGPVRGEPWDGEYVSACRYVGRVTEGDGGRVCTVEAKNRFAVGDTLELVSPGSPGRAFTVEALKNDAGEAVSGINCPRKLVQVTGAPGAKPGDFFRVRCEKNW